MKRFLVALMCMAICLSSFAKDGKPKKEPVYNEQGQIIKTGYNFGPLPAVAYDADKGFQAGAILQIYNYGDGSTYPNYFNRWYFEASYFTKGSMLFQMQHDNKNLIPGVRWSTSVRYDIDKAFDFYGFNGYQSFYDSERMDTKNDKKAIKKGEAQGDPLLYRYNPFYRINKTTLYAKSDFTGHITDNLYWEAGYHFRMYNQDMINRASINKGKEDYDTFPSGEGTFDGDTRAYQKTLFEQYLNWGLIEQKEVYNSKGKPYMFDSSVRLGLMYDSRNNEGAPSKGIWAEGHVILAPKWLGSSNSHYGYGVTFRHYLPIVKNDVLTFAYRLSYQGTIGKWAPYYALPYNTVVGNDADRDGNGGYRTTRGIIRTRVVGLDQALWTAEFRYKFVDFQLWKQNIAFSITAFSDGSMVTRGRDMTYKGNGFDFLEYKNYMGQIGWYDKDGGLYGHNYPEKFVKEVKMVNPLTGEGQAETIKMLKEMPHVTAGLGLRFIMNTNFIVAFEYGMPITRFFKADNPYRKQDGNGAFYINLGYLF